MSAVQVYVAKDEIEASIIKGRLESEGIKSTISPLNNNLPPYYGFGTGIAQPPFGVFVEWSKAEEAKKVLEEQV